MFKALINGWITLPVPVSTPSSYSRTPPSNNLVIPASTADPKSDQEDDDSLLASSPAAIVPVMEEVGPTATTATTIFALPGHYRHEDEREDKEYKETDLGAVDEQHKSVILHLLSQVSLWG